MASRNVWGVFTLHDYIPDVEGQQYSGPLNRPARIGPLGCARNVPPHPICCGRRCWPSESELWPLTLRLCCSNFVAFNYERNSPARGGTLE